MIPMTTSTIGLPAEQAIVRQVVYEVLPKLEDLFMTLERLQKVWNVPQNAIPIKIGTAMMTGQALAGYDPKDFVRWGETLLRLREWLDTEFTITFPDTTTETVTPESVLLTKYVPVE